MNTISMSPKYWELIADKLKAAGWSVAWVQIIQDDVMLWNVDASKHGKRYIARAENITAAFLAIEQQVGLQLSN